MKKITAHRIVGGLLIILVYFSSSSPVFAQAAEFTISNPDAQLFHGEFQGFGAEWDPFFWNSYNQNQGLTQADWDLITGRMQEMDIPIVRMWMQLYFARNYNGDYSQWDFENARMQSLYKHLDFACQNDIDVMLTDWAWSFWPSYKMFNGDPTNYGFAQAIAYYLKELIENRGYDCIKYLIVGNEPNNEILPSLGFAPYEAMINNVDRALKENGLRDKITFLGPDPSCCQGLFIEAMQSSLHATFDGYDFHHYAGEPSVSNGTLHTEFETRRDWIRDLSPDPNDQYKPLFITEAGMGNGVSDSFSHALSMADYGTTVLTSRIQGAIAWNMYDLYYDQGHSEFENNAMIAWGMWKYKDNDWALRPWAQPWGLLVKFAPQGSIQATVNNVPPQSLPSDGIHVAALKRPDNGWSIFLVNRNTSGRTLQISLPSGSPHTFTKYEVVSTTLSSYPDKIIPPSSGSINTTDNFSVTVPAQSFTVLVESATSVSPTVPPPTPTPVLTPGDVTGDGNVNLNDLSILLSNFGKSGMQRSQGDLISDGNVNLSDLSQLLANFGKSS